MHIAVVFGRVEGKKNKLKKKLTDAIGLFFFFWNIAVTEPVLRFSGKRAEDDSQKVAGLEKY